MFVVWWEKEKRKRKNSRRRTKNLGIKNEEYGFVFFVLSSSSRATDIISIRSSIRSNSETKTNREE